MKSRGVLPHQPSTKYHNIILFSVLTGMRYEFVYSEYNLHISRNHSWQWILENAHYISCLFFYLYICIRECIWIYRRSILFVYVTTGRCFVINCTSLTVSHSPNFWRQEQPICYNDIYMPSQFEKGDHDLLFIINT